VNHYIVHSYLFFNTKIESACQWESSKSKLVGWTKLTFFLKRVFGNSIWSIGIAFKRLLRFILDGWIVLIQYFFKVDVNFLLISHKTD
jgi:hypothetical protein